MCNLSCVFIDYRLYICLWTMFFFFFRPSSVKQICKCPDIIYFSCKHLAQDEKRWFDSNLLVSLPRKILKILGDLIWFWWKSPTKFLENHPGSEAYLIKFTKDTFCFKDLQGSLTPPPVFLRNGLYCEHEDVRTNGLIQIDAKGPWQFWPF